LIEIPNDAPVVACGHRILCAAAALHAHGITDIKNSSRFALALVRRCQFALKRITHCKASKS